MEHEGLMHALRRAASRVVDLEGNSLLSVELSEYGAEWQSYGPTRARAAYSEIASVGAHAATQAAAQALGAL